MARPSLHTFALLLVASAPWTTSPASAQCATERFRSPVAGHRSFFGNSVAVSGDTAVVSGLSSTRQRTAYVFERSPQGWAPTYSLGGGQQRTSYSTNLALDGDTLFLSNIDDQLEAGEVHTFERSGTTFAPAGVLVPVTRRPDSHFGRRLALDGDRAVIAAPMDASYEYRGGAVFVFERQLGAWTETARIDPPVPHHFGFFGLAVDIEGDLLAVGEPGYASAGQNNCQVHLYRLGLSGWVLEETLTGPHLGGFGYAVALAEGDVIVGAPGARLTPSATRGLVYEYRRSAGAWQLVQTIEGASIGASTHFGKTLTSDGQRLAVSATAPETNGSGPVIVMRRDGAGRWSPETTIVPAPIPGQSGTDAHGADLALDGDELWAGAPYEAPALSSLWVGAVYVHELPPVTLEYCAPTVANSQGGFGALAIASCSVAGSLQLELRASGLPPSSVGLLLLARPSGSIAVGGGVTLCLGSPIARFLGQAGAAGANGELGVTVDLGGLPPGAGSTVAIPGETLRFQLLYRDSSPAAPLNVTNGLALVVR